MTCDLCSGWELFIHGFHSTSCKEVGPQYCEHDDKEVTMGSFLARF